MRSVNKVTLLGNVGIDPESKSTPGGDAVLRFTVATSESWKDKNSGEQKEKTEWHTIIAWRKLAEIMGQYLKKGHRVYIEGKLQTRKWQDKNGVDRYNTEIVADEVIILTPKDQASAPAKAPSTAQPSKPAFEDDSDIPF